MAEAGILIADDDADIREVMALVLESYGYRVIGAADGDRAIELLKVEPVSLLVLDLMMPVMDGASVMKRLKGDKTLPTVPVVVLSGDSAAAETAASIGADACLLKPVDLECLLETVRRLSTGHPAGECSEI